MTVELTLGIVSLAIGAIGALVAVYFGRENRRLTHRLRQFGWHDIEVAVKTLSLRIEKEFAPDLILSSSGGSVGIVANLYLTYTTRFVPLYVGVSKHRGAQFTSNPIFHQSFTTNRWNTYIPEDVSKLNQHKVLILEDVVLSGETLTNLKSILISWGYSPDRIRSAAIFVSQLAVSQGSEPDYYWLRLPDTHFALPWGSSIGKAPR